MEDPLHSKGAKNHKKQVKFNDSSKKVERTTNSIKKRSFIKTVFLMNVGPQIQESAHNPYFTQMRRDMKRSIFDLIFLRDYSIPVHF